MRVEIAGYDPARIEKIKAAAGEEWPCADWSDRAEEFNASAEGQLCGGETAEEFTAQLSVAVWNANGAYCDVTVAATYRESCPMKPTAWTRRTTTG